LVVLAAALAFLGGACATAAPRAPTVGQLEVVNPSAGAIGVVIDGRAEGTARPKSRLLLRFVPSGIRQVVFEMPDGEADLHAIAIDPNVTTTWVIADESSRGEPLPTPLAALKAHNGLHQSAVIRVDGVTVGRILPGETRVFPGLLSGAVRAEALPDSGGATVTGHLDLAPGTTVDWEIAEEGHAVDVENSTSEALFVTVDGRAVGRVAPGQRRAFVVSPALHAFSAVSEPSRRSYESNIDTRADGTPDGESLWRVSQGSASLVVKNLTEDALTVVAGDAAPSAIAPGAAITIEGLASGPVAVRATSESGQIHVANYVLAADDQITWEVLPTSASIRVRNTSARTLVLYGAGGSGPLALLGKVGPMSAVAVNGLRPVNYRLEAFDIAGGQRFETTLDLAASGAATWDVRSETASARIANQKRERVIIKVDGGEFARLNPGEVRVATGLAPGPHLVESIGETSGVRRSEKVTLVADESRDVVFGDQVATVRVTNAAGESLLPLGPLRAQLETLAADADHAFLLAPGRHVLKFLGSDSGAVFDAPVTLVAGSDDAVTVRQTASRLKLVNGLPESVAVSRDGKVLTSVDAGATATLDGLTPGRCELQLVGLTSGRFRTLRAVLPPGGTEHLRVDPIGAVILVENRSPQSANVYLGRVLLGSAKAKSIAAFGHLAAGRHDLSVVFANSRETLTQALTLDEGERRLVIAELPAGSVLIENTSLEPVGISVDGATPLEIPREAVRTWLSVPVGSRRIDVAYRDSGLTETFQLQVKSGSAAHVALQPRHARLVLVNQHSTALEVIDGERPLATIGPESSMMLEDLLPGELQLRARAKDGVVTHAGRLSLRPGQTGTWVMVPLPLPPVAP